jgi:small subunit ribosomal protein S21
VYRTAKGKRLLKEGKATVEYVGSVTLCRVMMFSQYRVPSGGERKASSMIKVDSRPGEPIDRLIKRFKKQCEKEGLTKDIKKNSFYEKPSERRRREERNTVKKFLKEERLRVKSRARMLRGL